MPMVLQIAIYSSEEDLDFFLSNKSIFAELSVGQLISSQILYKGSYFQPTCQGILHSLSYLQVNYLINLFTIRYPKCNH